MKRVLTLALVGALVLGLAGFASAKEVQMKAQFNHFLTWTDNTDFDDSDREDDFKADQRIRVYFDYVASESLNAVLGFEINSEWGNESEGGDLGTDGNTVAVKHAYTNFVVPGTSVSARVGLQPVGFKGAYGSPIFDDDAAGILVSSPITDQVGLTVGWVRALDNADGEDDSKYNEDDIDIFTAILPVNMDGFGFTPYLIYGSLGADIYNAYSLNTDGGAWSAGETRMLDLDDKHFYAKGLVSSNPKLSGVDDNSSLFWGGLNFEVTMFDPFTVKGDIIYGSVNADDEENDRSGWFMDLGVEYAMDFGTLGVMGIYGSGDDDDENDGSETMPTLNDSGFGPTHFGFSGAQTGGTDSVLAGGDRYDLWAIGAYLADFSFVEDLSHKLIVVYGQGTTDGELVKDSGTTYTLKGSTPAITDEDSFWEVNFDSTYQIYENLACIAELGYINLDRDDDVWGDENDDDALKAAFYLKYDF
ncbi:outer membrane homotrimeric porin [Desulfobaculum sp. SPO524]|uniref:outer membrane homotrimeric porin n=1 Tax=Desulfobaculum sp. SPO524 TaxID=3378071 RepID=UPI0038531B3B